MSEELKPCPFCGDNGDKGTMQMFAPQTGLHWTKVTCRGCGASVSDQAWNIRAQDSELAALRDKYAILEESRDAEMLKVTNRDVDIAALRTKLEEREVDMHMRIRAEYDKTVADSWRAECDKLRTRAEEAERKLADKDRDRHYHMDAINRLASFLALSGTSFEVVQAAIDNMTRMASELSALRTKLEEVRGILAGPDAGSLPNDYPLDRMATDRMEERNKFMWQVRDTCTRAEEAERKLAEARAEGMEEAAKVCEEDESGWDSGGYFADAIRAKMKEQK